MPRPYGPVKGLEVELDKDPEDRWSDAVEDCREALQGLLGMLQGSVEAMGARKAARLAKGWEAAVTRMGMEELVGEVEGMAKALKTNKTLLIIGQLEYELSTAGCTTIVMRTPKGTPVMGRTLDWEASLSDLVVDITFTRGGVPVARCPSFIGLLGCTTGTSLTSRVAVALNHRPEEGAAPLSSEKAIQQALAARLSSAQRDIATAQPVTALLRKLILSPDPYDDVVRQVSLEPLIGSAYIVIVGLKDGVVVTRSKGEHHHRVLGDEPWASLVQCNHDGGDVGAAGVRMRDPGSVERHAAAVAAAAAVPSAAEASVSRHHGVSGISKTALRLALLRAFSAPPILCDETIFYSFAAPRWSSDETTVRKRLL